MRYIFIKTQTFVNVMSKLCKICCCQECSLKEVGLFKIGLLLVGLLLRGWIIKIYRYEKALKEIADAK